MGSLTERALMFDAKCSFWSNLAEQIRVLSKRPIALHALSDPKSKDVLSRYYPAGYPKGAGFML